MKLNVNNQKRQYKLSEIEDKNKLVLKKKKSKNSLQHFDISTNNCEEQKVPNSSKERNFN